LRVKIGTYPE